MLDKYPKKKTMLEKYHGPHLDKFSQPYPFPTVAVLQGYLQNLRTKSEDWLYERSLLVKLPNVMVKSMLHFNERYTNSIHYNKKERLKALQMQKVGLPNDLAIRKTVYVLALTEWHYADALEILVKNTTLHKLYS